jgi:DNA-binding transcriptional LysR family regulator
LRLADLIAHPLIVGHSETYGRHLLDQALHRDGLDGRLLVAAETDNSAFTCALVRAGGGIGVIAGRADGMLTHGLAVRSLQRSLGQIWIVFARQAGRQPTAAVRTLMELIRESATSKK